MVLQPHGIPIRLSALGSKDVKARRKLSRVVYRPRAGSDISDIWDFIAEDSVLQADSWVDNLDAKLRLLATQPLMGRAREELLPGLRSHPFGRYVIFYMPLSMVSMSSGSFIQLAISTVFFNADWRSKAQSARAHTT